LTHLRDLLLELGRGFSFVGSQVPLTVDGQTFYIDLLFYHVRLHRYFVFELKVGAFQPQHAGKLGFYLAAVNGMMRTPVEGPSIGVLLCESRSGPIVEFALETINQPIGVSAPMICSASLTCCFSESLTQIYHAKWRMAVVGSACRRDRHPQLPKTNLSIISRMGSELTNLVPESNGFWERVTRGHHSGRQHPLRLLILATRRITRIA